MKRPRPTIPESAKHFVLCRQLLTAGFDIFQHARHDWESLPDYRLRMRVELARVLGCDVSELHLDHNPALILREFNPRTGKYTPDANDPEFLIYRTKHDHLIKTVRRGDGAQRSDISERQHQRILAKNREKRRAKTVGKGNARKSAARPQRKIPSRPFPKGRKMDHRVQRSPVRA